MQTFIDLFCGIGGFRLGLERHGLQCVFSSEINPQARFAYKTNFNEVPGGDITEIAVEDIPPHDIITAGFPCQSFSVAGNRGGFNDPRGQLFFEIIRIANHHRPKLILLENVPRLKTAENGAILRRITAELDSIGYYLTSEILNASNYGIPQARKRWFGVAIRKDTNLTWSAPIATNELCCVGDIMLPDDEVDDKVWVKNKVVITFPHNLHRKANEILRVGQILRLDETDQKAISQGMRVYSDNGVAVSMGSHQGGITAKTGLYVKAGQSSMIASSSGHAFTQTASADRDHGIRTNGLYVKAGQGMALHSKNGLATTSTASKCYRASGGVYYTNHRARALTNNEMKAVMGFPAEHFISEGYHGRAQLGNAIIPKMAELVYSGIGRGLI